MNWDVGGGSFASVSVCTALVVVRWRASWSLVLLAMLWFPSSDDCVEDCISVSSSKDGTTRVQAMLSCSLLDCDEGWNRVSSPEDNTIIVGALRDHRYWNARPPTIAVLLQPPCPILFKGEAT